MRKRRTSQVSIFERYSISSPSTILDASSRGMSRWLDEHAEVLEWVEADLRGHQGVKHTGREGMTVESVLRCGLLKHHRQLSY